VLHREGKERLQLSANQRATASMRATLTIHSNGLSSSLAASATETRAAERSDTRMMDLPTRMEATMLLNVCRRTHTTRQLSVYHCLRKL